MSIAQKKNQSKKNLAWVRSHIKPKSAKAIRKQMAWVRSFLPKAA